MRFYIFMCAQLYLINKKEENFNIYDFCIEKSWRSRLSIPMETIGILNTHFYILLLQQGGLGSRMLACCKDSHVGMVCSQKKMNLYPQRPIVLHNTLWFNVFLVLSMVGRKKQKRSCTTYNESCRAIKRHKYNFFHYPTIYSYMFLVCMHIKLGHIIKSMILRKYAFCETNSYFTYSSF